MAPSPIVTDFMKCLQKAEENRDAKELSQLFTEDCELFNLTRQNTHTRNGINGRSLSHSTTQQNPAQYWRQYLNAFDHISSHFTNVIDDGRVAVLEWHSSGSLPMGLPIEYNGVSIIEHDGLKIRKFRTYYDSAAFLPHAAYSNKPYSETVGLPDMSPEISS